VSAADLAKIVQILQTFAGYVVIDTPAQFNDVVLNLLEVSDDILLIAGMDIPNIKNVKLGLQTLRLLNTPMSKIKLVLNRANSKVKLDVSEVERALAVKADCLVPSDIVVPQSVNKGVPAVLDAPKSGVSKSLAQLADLLISERAVAR
jgi:pilus assembly protein CpaE